MAQAATYYVGPGGQDSNSCTQARTATTPRLTIQSALTCLAAGDTLVIQSGTYSGTANALTNLPSGTSTGYITIQADVDGGVIITSGLSTAHTNSYLSFVGLRFEDTTGRNITGNHIKFFRCGFKGGCATGNCTNTTVGSNDVTDTADLLFEDSWFYGSGGRYNLLIYNSDRVVVRRVVIRHDGGWNDSADVGDPEAGLMFYNSANLTAMNVIVIDSNSQYVNWAASFYSGKNSSVPHLTQNNSWLGSIALVGSNVGLRVDGDTTNNVVQDVAFWDTSNGGISFGTGNTTATVTRATLGRTQVASAGDFMGGVGGWGTGAKSASNSIFANFTSGLDLNSVTGTYFDTYNNASASSGAGSVSYSPFANGLKYLTRIESGSLLQTGGASGGQIGATIVNRLGVAGSLTGDTGWNTDTGVALWPWPNEARIKNEMCTQAGVTRGFCSDSSLTNYIWNYLGNGNPVTGTAPHAPTDVRIIG